MAECWINTHKPYLLTAWSRVFLEKLTGFAANQEIPRILWNPKIDYRTHKRPPCLWVPVTTAWRILRLRMEERPPIWWAAANNLNKQSRTADKGRSFSLGVGRGANNSSPWKTKCFEILIGEMLPLETKQSGGKILPHSDLRGGECFWRRHHATGNVISTDRIISAL